MSVGALEAAKIRNVYTVDFCGHCLYARLGFVAHASIARQSDEELENGVKWSWMENE